MQTKILSILALLLTVTQGAWAQVGRVLAADGKYYKTVTAATNAGTTASGMIVYWGDGDTSDNTYNQGLAIALSDVVNNGQWGAQQQDVTDITNTGRDATISMVDLRGIANTDAIVSKWPTGTYSYAADHCVSMSTARPSSSSNWFLPSQGQFVLMMNSYGAGYGTSTPYAYNNITKETVVTAINNALTNAGGTALSNGRYWTSTEPDYKVAADWAADNSSFGLNDKTLEQNVRAMFAFSGATAAEYTVSYNANGGSGAPDDQTKDGGIDLTLSSAVPTRDGYTFAGWATSADGAVAYSAGGSYTTNNNIVLYAQWTPTYTVTVKSSTEDASNWQGKAGTGEYQALPLEGVAAGTAVSAKYSGTKMVKSVKAKKKAAALIVNPAVGQVIGSDGKNYAADATLPSGVTAVAKIVYVGDNCEAEPYNHGLALALSDASTGCEWSTSANSTVHTYNADTPAFASESGLQYNATHNTDAYPAFKAAIANNGTAAPTGCSSWFLPSGYQWHQMTAEGYDYLGLGDNGYWTSTESDAAYAWYFSPEAAIGYPFTKDDNNKRVRSCLAF